MASKVIYFTVAGKEEQAEFSGEDSQQEVYEIFRSAAEAGPLDILKLYNVKGHLIKISQGLEANSQADRYKLEVVATHCEGSIKSSELGVDISNLDERLRRLERIIKVDGGEMPDSFHDLKRQIDDFRTKLESVEHLSWLGLFKDPAMQTGSAPFWCRKNTKKVRSDYSSVNEKFLKMTNIHVSDEVRDYLRKPTFDNWQWDDSEMLVLLRQMFIELNLTSKFNISLPKLHEWLFEVYLNYNNVPFHNFKHCFMVSQMMYGLICLTEVQQKIDDLDILILLISAICHDLDHPGYNNAYQINAKTELALRYNDISPLENHHCAKAFEILGKVNFLSNLPAEQFKAFREGMIKCVLATDMAKHSEILTKFKDIIPTFDFNNKEHKSILLMILIKTADISNESRPTEVADPWVECLLEEFFTQSDLEKLEGLPVAPFMDRDKVNKPSSQIGFIKFVLLPLFEALGDLYPVIEADVIVPVRNALQYYQKMADNMEVERKRHIEKRPSLHMTNN